jgi:hypothetical protein
VLLLKDLEKIQNLERSEKNLEKNPSTPDGRSGCASFVGCAGGYPPFRHEFEKKGVAGMASWKCMKIKRLYFCKKRGVLG